ncbi:hypothetical protein DFP73DRAFT_634437 [Morchella snyderi]|nr:hypothetical protein DFP73DRAFT_634437 [Morchella snyderi]
MPFIFISIAYARYRAGRISGRTFLCLVVHIVQYTILHICVFFINMWRLYVVIAQSTRPINTITCTNTTPNLVIVNLPQYRQVRNIQRWREDGVYHHEDSETRMVRITGTVCEHNFEPVVRGTSGVYGVERGQGPMVLAFPLLHGERFI